ncbi:MAG TPA: STAS domain-containing protein [Candidatus Krumholzibacteria bacterium]|nr:STAS domain-containing protein [Candidatus Krumholzibacteria bacterium]
MRIRRDDRDAVTVLHLSGAMTGGPDAETFEGAVDELIDDRRHWLVLDFGGVSFLGSQAIGYVARYYARFVRAGGQVVTARISGRVALPYDLFLRQLLEAFDTVDEAVDVSCRRAGKDASATEA